MDIGDYIIDGRLSIIAKANSPKTEITGYDTLKKAVKVNVKAHPEKGRANAEIIKFFTRLTKKNVEIISGKTSRQKTLRIKSLI